MSEPQLLAAPPSSDVDLHTILEAWNTATERLRQTHELLTEEVRRLSDELEAKNRELARKNRLADLGQMASHVAHEVRNGLVPLKLYLSLLRRRVTSDVEGLSIADKIGSGFIALERVVNDLLQFSSHRDPQCAPFNVREMVEELCESLRPQLLAQKIETTFDFADDAPLNADRDMIRRAVLNLVLNAFDAMREGGSLRFIGRNHDSGYELAVSDTGPGLSDDVLQRAFEPFFTTKGHGTGLGLSIVYRIAEMHRGEILVRNLPTGGASFSLRIPRLESEVDVTRRAA